MKRMLVLVLALGVFLPAARAQTNQGLAIIDEKLDKIRAEVEDLQFKHQKMQEQLDDLQEQINHLRKTDNTADVAGLEAKIKALDAARERDKKVILDTLSEELAKLSTARATAPAGSSGTEHVVQKGETLSAIATKYGVTADAIVRANNLNNPNALQIGQKLTIPK
jgi:LysM repeat protein